MRNWILSFVVLLAGISAAHAGEPILTAPQAWAQAKAGKLVIIDVRSPGEWRQTGIPKGAKAITIHDPGGPAAFVAKVRAALKGNPNARIALICAAGVRSNRAQGWLRAAGFTNIIDISEGMMGRSPADPGWLRRNLPTERWTPK